MLLSQHIVVHIVCRRNLQTSRTELHIHVIVFYHGNDAPYKRNYHFLPLQPLVFRIIRINAHGRISHNGFGTGCRHHGITSFRIALHLVTKVVQFAMFLLIDNLFIRKSSLSFRIPIHHSHTTIYQALVIQIDKDLDHTFRTFLVHRECCSLPIARSTYALQLFQNNTSVLLCPSPRMLQELIPCQLTLLYTFLGQTVHHLGFCRYRGVVCSRNPTSIFALHTGTTH